ncbi:3-methyladenine DNA glycosylase [Francisella tularensis subsp. novicida GA99-3548]|uniref:DNA-3-methyladenine glycosylase I n=1 Tax=Francisella tularensis TaxID=263 RepID=UPI000158B2EE|nr:DNA-3-methyladenine glycosylase I [Francisella tularensis]AJI72444.1 methyladenine glycosylase family protein [Francisella tularensis subsp. novicida D9876]EDN37477.1 3-methyladenine DNA glycosylase [Francisella tularensis subsp. novicida GA99-3548]MBK2110754.1 DNA-3-methyladenine glycosylase I [Francisella tularensis subsp. novicida FSC159]
MYSKNRCFGNKPNQELYASYHDNEWGIPKYDDNELFELLILEGAQAGLNWETILKKRQGYRDAFYNFDPIKVASMSDSELEVLRDNPNIIRNKLKIYSARKNAQVFLQIQKEYGSFSDFLWGFVNFKPIKNSWKYSSDVPTATPISEKISKDLKERGMNFIGPTIIYAYMQATGLVNDHLVDCWRHLS